VIARVIVEQSGSQLDRPFDYLVPVKWQTIVRPGCRVIVPFGNRTSYGYVIGVTASSQVEKLKTLTDLLDEEPVITEEMLELANWISRFYVCTLFQAIQLMVPQGIKPKHEKLLMLDETRLAAGELVRTEEEDELLAWLRSRRRATYAEAVNAYPGLQPLLDEWISRGIIAVHDQLSRRVNEKTIRMVVPVEALSLQQGLASLSTRAVKQEAVLRYFLEHGGSPVPVKDLMQALQVNHATLTALERMGLIGLMDKTVQRDPFKEKKFVDKAVALTEQQKHVIKQITAGLDEPAPHTFLLHGVTGSGKTEIYLHSIEACLNKGKEAIILVPEIALTPQMVARFKGRFGDRVAVLHSGLSPGERLDEWYKIHRGEVSLVMGARSAIFAPFKQIGLIVIDEEHETSYKQEDAPKYHAREVALRRIEAHRATLVLGSATPSLETYYAARRGEYGLLRLPERVNRRPFPKVEIVDMSRELKQGHRSMFSRALIDKIKERADRREQIILFLNRRGYATFVMCRSCGYAVQCPDCDISMTYHQKSDVVRCHYCGYAKPAPQQCPVCASTSIRYFGTGTQRVEEALNKLFPNLNVIRMDVDTTSTKGAHERLLERFRRREADVLLGTQMIAKGLDFPHVTLVGVIAADTVLRLPDFRSAEKTFQLLTQVSGRAGRHELPGEVVIQTYTTDHYSVRLAAGQDFEQFAREELDVRRRGGYPPYTQLALLTWSHPELGLVMKQAERMAQALRKRLQGLAKVYHPVASPIPRIKNSYRIQCMVKYNHDFIIQPVLKEVIQSFEPSLRKESVKLSVDIHPQFLM